MSQIPRCSLYFIIVCAILLLLSPAQSKVKSLQPPSKSHETVINFLQKQNDGPLFYWIILDAQFQSHNFTTAIQSLLGSVEAVKVFIDLYKAKKPVKESEKPKIILGQTLENINQIFTAINSYRLKLSELQIVFQKNFILDQEIIIRVKDDRKELANFIDQLKQTVLAFDKGLNLLGIQRFSEEKFYQNSQYPNEKVSVEGQTLIESKKFTQKVLSKAQCHCKSLQMSLGEILSTKQLILQQLRNDTLQNVTSTDAQNFKEMNFSNAYEQRDLSQTNQFFYRLFQVKAKCNGNQPLREVRAKNKGQKQYKIQHDENMTGPDLQRTIKKHKKPKIIID